MTGSGQGPVLPCEGALVVFDDASRLCWCRRSTDAWSLRSVWPTADERREVLEHVDGGGLLLVVARPDCIGTDAWRHELPDPALLRADADTSTDLVHLELQRYDWLPGAARVRGEAFMAQERARRSSEPSLLQPLLRVEPATGRRPDGVAFAVASPDATRSRIERDLAPLIAYLSDPRGAEAA